MSDAWIRMRAVSRLPNKPVTKSTPSGTANANQKVKKHVRWGSVRTYECEQRYQSDDKGSEVKSEQEHRGRATGKNEQRPTTSAKKAERNVEIWTPVDTGSKHETWGPVKTGSEHEIWGDTPDNTF